MAAPCISRLDKLPHEILLEITGHLGPWAGTAIQKKYGIYPTLSLVNRRLHDFAGHLVFREIRVSLPSKLFNLASFLGRTQIPLSAIRLVAKK
jgi:hypothetical protein